MMHKATLLAFGAAVLYALSLPLGKIFLSDVGPYSLAAYLYLGAGLGMACLVASKREKATLRFAQNEIPFVIGMVILDIIAPLLLLLGLRASTAATASALTNFEIVATSIIALLLFHEAITSRTWLTIGLITIASLLMSLDGGMSFSMGSLLILGATMCWGLENNCTRMLSHLDSSSIVLIKGMGAGVGAGIVALIVDGRIESGWITLLILLTGFATYGLSIDLYIRAQAFLGAAKTSAYYASAPFIGVALSFLLLRESVPAMFWPGLALMAIATYVLITDSIHTQHTHEHTHDLVIEHAHGSLTHSHLVTVTHSHLHTHGAGSDDHTHDHSDLSDQVPPHTHDPVRS